MAVPSAHVSSDLFHDLIQKPGFGLVAEDQDLSGKTREDQSQGPLLNALVEHFVQSDVLNVATADAFLDCGCGGPNLRSVLEAIMLALIIVMLVTAPIVCKDNLAWLLRRICLRLVPSPSLRC